MYKIAVVPNTNGAYVARSDGKIFSRITQSYEKGKIGPNTIINKNIIREKLAFTDTCGYLRVAISYPNEVRKSKKVPVHTLMLESFRGPRPKNYEASHMNGIKTDNRISNLRWMTKIQNQQLKVKHGTHLRGSRHPNSKLTEHQMIEIKKRNLAGESYRKLAKEFGCTHRNIAHIKFCRPWIKA